MINNPAGDKLNNENDNDEKLNGEMLNGQEEKKRKKIRIIAFSDSHGDAEALKRLIPIINTSDYCFFLGDGLSAVIKQKSKIKTELYAVNGNCDISFFGKTELIVRIGQCNFLLTHGHKFDVKQTYLKLRLHAQSQNCGYAVFGHTHIPTVESDKNVTLINPGSLYSRSGYSGTYAVIEGDGVSFSCEIKTVNIF